MADRYECENDCGFRGSFAEVDAHEAACTAVAHKTHPKVDVNLDTIELSVIGIFPSANVPAQKLA